MLVSQSFSFLDRAHCIGLPPNIILYTESLYLNEDRSLARLCVVNFVYLRICCVLHHCKASILYRSSQSIEKAGHFHITQADNVTLLKCRPCGRFFIYITNVAATHHNDYDNQAYFEDISKA